MDLSEYQRQADASANVDHGNTAWRLLVALSLAAEAGEVVDLVKKIEGKPLNLTRGLADDVDAVALLDEEIGDALWSLAVVAAVNGRDLGAIAHKSLAKVRARYPENAEAPPPRGDLDTVTTGRTTPCSD